jgi:hypothetical protein
MNTYLQRRHSFAEPLSACDSNIPDQTRGKLTVKRPGKKDDKKLSRDSMFKTNWQKCRAGIILNPANISGDGV